MKFRGWQVIYDDGCPICRLSRRWLARRPFSLPVVFLGGQELGLSPENFQEIRLRTPEGSELRGFRAVARLLGASSRCPWFWRAMECPPLVWVGQGLYRLVARHRHRFPVGCDW